MDSPLLATSESHGSVGTETGVFYNLLERKDHQSIRLIFLLLSQFLFFILGAGLYVFPLWLNFIVTDNVSLSREALSLLGAVPFIGILGTGGGLILFVNWIQGISKTSKFILLTFTGASMIILAWGLLFLVIENTPEDKNNSNVVIIFSVLLLIGTAISIFFTTFLDKIFPLLKQKHHFIYGAFCNTGFALGSIFSLGAKLFMNTHIWMCLLLTAECVTMGGVALFVWWNVDKLLLSGEHITITEVSTKQLLMELLTWKRQLKRDALMTRDCQVTSRQFYWLLLSFTAVCTLATCFMANLGPLLSAESSDDEDLRSQVIVLLWSSVGQTTARLLIPLTAHCIRLHITRQVTAECAATEGAAADEGGAGSAARLNKVLAIKVSNATTLPFTFAIGLVCFVMLISLLLSGRISFVVASTVISSAYGSMWVVTSAFPQLFPAYNYAVLLSFFQIFGMLGMIIFVVVTAYICRLDNDGICEALLAAAVVTMLAAAGAMADRSCTAPKGVFDEEMEG